MTIEHSQPAQAEGPQCFSGRSTSPSRAAPHRDGDPEDVVGEAHPGEALQPPGRNVRLVFGKRRTGVDLDTATVSLIDIETGRPSTAAGDAVVGAAGAFSAVRH